MIGARKRKRSEEYESEPAAPGKLREWVKVSSLSTPPEPPARDWHKTLQAGSEAEMRHDGGYWHVVVKEHALRGVVKKGDRFVVRVVGYDVERTVKPAALRPRAASS